MATGSLTLADIRDNRRSVLENPLYDRRNRLLFDLSRVTSFAVRSIDLQGHAAAGSATGPRYSRIAMLAPNDLAFGFARVYGAYVSEQYDSESLRVFRDKHAAWSWLFDVAPG